MGVHRGGDGAIAGASLRHEVDSLARGRTSMAKGYGSRIRTVNDFVAMRGRTRILSRRTPSFVVR